MARRRSAGSSNNSAKNSGDSAANAVENTSTDMDATILDLKAALESVQPKDTVLVKTLEKQISDLQAELETKDTLIAKLQSQLQAETQQSQQVKQLQDELEDARKMILKLSEVNAKPLSIPAAAPKAESKPEPKVESRPEPKAQPAPQSTLQIAPRSSQHDAALRKILDHPTQPGSPPAMPSEKEGKLSEIEIGWMD